MELTAYIRLFRRWSWLILIAAVLAGSISYVVSRSQPPSYQASTTLQVGSYLNLSNPDAYLLTVGQQLARNYAEIAKTYPILKGTVDALQLNVDPDKLAGAFKTQIINNTSLLVLTVTYNDPVLVSDIANELANQLIINSPTNLTKDQQAQIALLEDQVARVKTQLDTAQAELDTVNASLSATPAPDDPAALRTRRNQLTDQINAARANLAQFSSTLGTLQQQGSSNTLSVVELARIPDAPINGSPLTTTLLGTFVGAVLAAGLALVIEYFNDSVRSPSEIGPLTGARLLGTVAPYGKKGTYLNKLITWNQPRSTISEAYRALRVSLMYTAKDDDKRQRFIYVVTSSNPAEGKSVTAANLAVTFSMTGMQVLLVDADLRRPSQQLIFEVPNNKGLTNLLSEAGAKHPNGVIIPDQEPTQQGDPAVVRAARQQDLTAHGKTQGEFDHAFISLLIQNVIQKTPIQGLDLITTGALPANPSELMGTVQMQQLVRAAAENAKYDVIIFDSPPSLTVSDSAVLANNIEGEVIVVVESGRTRRATLQRTVQQLMGLSIPIAGIVMNRLHARDVDAGYGYYYYGYYGYGTPGATQEQLPTNQVRPMPAMPPVNRVSRNRPVPNGNGATGNGSSENGQTPQPQQGIDEIKTPRV